MRSPTVMRLERMRLEKTLGVVETALDGQDYLLASGFSAVDCSIGYCVYVARFFTNLDRFPRTREYFERIAERAAFQATLPVPGKLACTKRTSTRFRTTEFVMSFEIRDDVCFWRVQPMSGNDEFMAGSTWNPFREDPVAPGCRTCRIMFRPKQR